MSVSGDTPQRWFERAGDQQVSGCRVLPCSCQAREELRVELFERDARAITGGKERRVSVFFLTRGAVHRRSVRAGTVPVLGEACDAVTQ